MDHQTLALAIRWLHVVAMSLALGGALFMAWLSWRLPAVRVLDIAVRYEQLFWAAAGVLVMTGVGNLGAFGLALPAPGTAWGATFTTKLLLVTVLVVLSLPRSLAIARLAATTVVPPGTLRLLYSVTAGVFGAIVALAELLAHG